MTAAQDDTIAELQRANAELRQDLAARDATLAQRNSEYGERIEHQAATIDVLKAMSASPGDPQPVFDLIVQRARDLCDAYGVTVTEFDGTLVYHRASTGISDDPGDREAVVATFPMRPRRDILSGRAILDRQIIRIDDLQAEPDLHPMYRHFMAKSTVLIPLLRGDVAIGTLGLGSRESAGFTDSQIELLKTFAEQAVIAITSAETYRALQTRTSDLQESLEYQTATSDVLKVISRSTFDLQPVLDTVVQTAARLCDADQAVLSRREGDLWRLAANFGFPPEYETYFKELGPEKFDPDSPTIAHRTAIECRPVHIDDVAAVPGYPEALIRLGKHRTSLGVPLLREGESIGIILLARQRIEPFTDRQIALVSTFADQAVIAMENARLMTEQREALDRQTAMAEVLQVINASPGNLMPVFDAILEKAMRLCGAAIGGIYGYDGQWFHPVALRGVTPAFAAFSAEHRVPSGPNSAPTLILKTKRPAQIPDLADYPGPYTSGMVDLGGIRSLLDVPLLKEDTLLGFIAIYREEAGTFSDKQIVLLENFAAQAVIAMENARLLDEIRQRQEELRITFENMGDGVAMFDETQHLVAWNRKFQDILDVPDDIIARRQTFTEYVRYLADRGEYGAGPGVEEQVRHLTEQVGQYRAYERTRPDGRVIEIRHNPVPDGGFVLIFSDITDRKRSEAEIRAARDAAEEASRMIEAAYRDLKAAQANLIQAEKMASLGQLTAGIAHEIKNPLNFVNNFAALSVDLLSELKETAAPGFAALTDKQRAEVEDVSAMLTSNLEKITEHGKRADSIVKAMLEHSRGSSAERRMVDLSALIDEALNLAYHGARAQDQSFKITLERDFGQDIAQIEVNPQDMTRVFLNVFSNGFYAATKRARNGEDARFEPTLKVTTRNTGDAVEIRVRDNGTGIQADIRDKLFQPFFTTKPTGEGTGLGLSITYDIVTKAHGGSIAVDSKVGDYSEFTIRLPRNL